MENIEKSLESFNKVANKLLEKNFLPRKYERVVKSVKLDGIVYQGGKMKQNYDLIMEQEIKKNKLEKEENLLFSFTLVVLLVVVLYRVIFYNILKSLYFFIILI